MRNKKETVCNKRNPDTTHIDETIRCSCDINETSRFPERHRNTNAGKGCPACAKKSARPFRISAFPHHRKTRNLDVKETFPADIADGVYKPTYALSVKRSIKKSKQKKKENRR